MKTVRMCGLLLVMMLMPNATIRASTSDIPHVDPIERAKDATVGILRHSSDAVGKTAAQFSIRGSGVHLGDGYILTARHAIERFEGGKTIVPSDVHVITGDLTELRTKLVGVNAFLDVALYRIQDETDREALASVHFRADELQQGREVFTVGYPLGWGPALAFGKVGNPHTFLPTANSRLIQVDLAACSGNSGGGLFAASGDLVGVIHAIIQTETGKGERRCSRFAFAVPGPIVEKMVHALMTGNSPGFSRLGIQMTVVKVANQWRVAVAKAKGPARKAGIRKNDVILAIDEVAIKSAAQLKSYLIEQTAPGQIANIRVRRGETEAVFKVTLGASS